MEENERERPGLDNEGVHELYNKINELEGRNTEMKETIQNAGIFLAKKVLDELNVASNLIDISKIDVTVLKTLVLLGNNGDGVTDLLRLANYQFENGSKPGLHEDKILLIAQKILDHVK